MIRELKYVNSLGKSISFGGESDPMWHFGETDLFNIDLDYNTVGTSITSFSTGIREFSLKVFMKSGSIDERNRFIDVVSYDTYLASHGTLYAGGSYLKCYVRGFDAASWQYSDDRWILDITLVSDRPVWIREEVFTLVESKTTPIGGHNYPHDYPHNYLMANNANTNLTNPFQLPAKCDISFAGPCVSPYVIIGGNRYQVDASAEKGELVIIRGMGTKGIVVKASDGTEQSVFDKGIREAHAMVFAEVPVGDNVVSWPGTSNIEVKLYEERRSPWQM